MNTFTKMSFIRHTPGATTKILSPSIASREAVPTRSSASLLSIKKDLSKLAQITYHQGDMVRAIDLIPFTIIQQCPGYSETSNGKRDRFLANVKSFRRK